MIDRVQIEASAAGSLRLEGLEPSAAARDFAVQWARGELSDMDLKKAERCLLSGEPLENVLPALVSASVSRAV